MVKRTTAEATVSGAKGVREFVSSGFTLLDSPGGEFGPQVKFVYADVIVTEHDTSWQPDNGVLTEFITDSDNIKGKYMKKLGEMEVFVDAKGLEGEDAIYALEGQPIRWKQFKTSDAQPATENKAAFPAGYAYVPVEIVDLDNFEAPKPEVDDPSDEIIAAVVAALDEELTLSLIQRALKGKKAYRDEMTAIGGLDIILSFMVEHEQIVVTEEGAYSRA